MKREPNQPPDFERALVELESLVAKLESGELSLDQSLEYFKRGVELTRHCQAVLDQAQQTVEMLSRPETAAGQDSVEDQE